MAAAESIPDGHTMSLMYDYAKKHNMVIVVPIYEEELPAINTAAVIDDGSYLGKYRKTHIPQVDPVESFSSSRGDLGYPVFETAYVKLGVYICHDRHFPGWRALALNGAEYIVNPSATVAGLSKYLGELEQPASAAATVSSSAPSTELAIMSRGPRKWVSSTAPATSSTREARLRHRRATTRTNCSCMKSTSTWCEKSATRNSSATVGRNRMTADRLLAEQTVGSESQVVQKGELYELEAGDDIATVRASTTICTDSSQRTWTKRNVASLWVGMAICVPTYTLWRSTSYFGLSVTGTWTY